MSEEPGAISVSAPSSLYIFLDEGGNFDFSPGGTQYFTLTSVTASRPFAWDAALMSLKYDELERGSDAEYFHASEDKQIVRNRVFATIAQHVDTIRIDSIIVPKRKIVPELRLPEKFYPRMLGYLLRYVVQHESLDASTAVLAVTDIAPVKARQKAIAKGVEDYWPNCFPVPCITASCITTQSRASAFKSLTIATGRCTESGTEATNGAITSFAKPSEASSRFSRGATDCITEQIFPGKT